MTWLVDELDVAEEIAFEGLEAREKHEAMVVSGWQRLTREMLDPMKSKDTVNRYQRDERT